MADTVWRWRWLSVAVAWTLALLSAVVVSFVSDRYQANAQVFVDTQTVLKPLMAGLAYQPDIDQQVKMLARTLISRPNIERVITNAGLGRIGMDSQAREAEVTRLMSRIRVEGTGNGNLYAISYRDTQPEQARLIVEATVDLFVSSSTGHKRRDSEEASHFIDDQIETYEAKLVESENRLKEFKMRNFGMTGVSQQDYFSRVSRLSDDVNKLRLDLNAAEQTRDAYRRELSQEEPQLPNEPSASLPAVPSEVDIRLEAQRKQLDESLRRFTDEHPDVISARRVIAQLEAQKRQESEQRAKAGVRGGRAAATSPVYQRLRIALAEAEAQVASLRSQLAAQQARLEDIRKQAGKAPEIEAGLAQLNRDYEVIRKNYEQLVARRESASLGIKLDESNQLADFRVVEPPRVSPVPVFPSRVMLGMLCMLASLAAGVGAALAKEKLLPTFRGTAALQAAMGRPVIGTVRELALPSAQLIRRADVRRLAGATACLLLLQATWLAWMAHSAAAGRGMG